MFFLPDPEREYGKFYLQHMDGFIETFYEVRKFCFDGDIFALAFLNREEERFIFCKFLSQKEIEDIDSKDLLMMYDCTNEPLTNLTLGRAVRIFFRDTDDCLGSDPIHQKLAHEICKFLLEV